MKHLSPLGGFHTQNVIFGILAAILVTIATEWTNQKPHMGSLEFVTYHYLLWFHHFKIDLDNVIFGMLAAILVTMATEWKEPIKNCKWGHMTLSTNHHYVPFLHLGFTYDRTKAGRKPVRNNLYNYSFVI